MVGAVTMHVRSGVNPWDQTWLKAMADIYPVDDVVLPHWEDARGYVDAKKTLANFLRLIGVGVDNETGKILDPADHHDYENGCCGPGDQFGR